MSAAASNAFNTVALIGKYQSREIAESLRALATFLRKRGVEVLLEEDTAKAVGANGYTVASYEIDRRPCRTGDGTRRRRHHAAMRRVTWRSSRCRWSASIRGGSAS